jgi:hypothetical protein
VTPENGSNSTGKRSADAMLMTLPTTTMEPATSGPPRTLNVMQDIGTLDAEQKNNDDAKHAPPNLLQQLVGKAKSVKRRKLGVHKAQMASALYP